MTGRRISAGREMTMASVGKMGGNVAPKKYGVAVLAACIGTAAAAVASQRHSTQAEKKVDGDGGSDRHFLEMYLMDRIAKKPYLNHHSASSAAAHQQHQARRYYRGRQGEEEAKPTAGSGTTGAAVESPARPKGVPSRLRLLAIDVPQFKEEAFERGGVCRLPSEVFDTKRPKFVDGVAPPKPMNSTLGHNERTGTRATRKPIVQKSLAKQLYYCYDPQRGKDATSSKQADVVSTSEGQRPLKERLSQPNEKKQEPKIGVEILEASVMDLNPNNIRRAYYGSSGGRSKKSYSYDPGKYTEGADTGNRNDYGASDVESDGDDEESDERPDGSAEESDIDNPDYERTAPWNQYAWLEEIHLRINGIVPFGAPVERAHLLSQWLYGRIYRQPVPTSPSNGGWVSWLWWPVLWTGSHAIGGRGYRTSCDGVDGEGECGLYGASDGVGGGGARKAFRLWGSSKAVLNRASNKPHAVVCDGQAMQRVPGSLRYLTKICREAGIPLYILNDPRSWGSQTHSTLADALVDLRKAVSDNVIRNALDLREGGAFERGRLIGQLEKEMAWQAYDAARKTREALMDARKRLRKEGVEEWCDLSEDELLRKLIERKVIALQSGEEGGSDDVTSEQIYRCTDEFLEVCKRCCDSSKATRPSPAEKNVAN